jgi:hypothetical protein
MNGRISKLGEYNQHLPWGRANVQDILQVVSQVFRDSREDLIW